MNRQLFVEQADSLVRCLVEAGIEHGDTATLDLIGVGLHAGESGMPSLAFCPAEVFDVRILKRGGAYKRRQPIPPIVAMSNNLRRRIFERRLTH